MPVSAQHMAVCKNLFLLCLKVVTVEGVVVGEQCVWSEWELPKTGDKL